MFNRSALARAKYHSKIEQQQANNNNTSPLGSLLVVVVVILVLIFLPSTIASTDDSITSSPVSGGNFSSQQQQQKWAHLRVSREDNNSNGENRSLFERLLSGGGNLLSNFNTFGTGRSNEHQHLLEINELAESRGFSIESHRVTTSDGYILTIHRLVNPLLLSRKGSADSRSSERDGNFPRGRVPIIVQHGILCASPFFLMNSSPQLDRPSELKLSYRRRDSKSDNYDGEINNVTDQTSSSSSIRVSNSLAFELAQRGHDVWLTNFRGTEYSRSHQRPDLNEGAQNESSYWDFNVDTLIERDLSAYVRYVLDLTGQRRYMFIGHSLGATVGLGSLLVHRESRITRQLSCALLMAPVASTQFMRGQLISSFRAATLVYREPGPFPGATHTFSSFVSRVCPHLRQLCLWLANMFIGAKRNGRQPSHSHSVVAAAAAPSSSHPNLSPSIWMTRQQQQQQQQQRVDDDDDGGEEFRNQVNTFLMMMRQLVSVQMLKHIVQVHSSGRLSRFNHGPSINKLRHGSELAPVYNLSQIRQPHLRLAIVSGQSDAISTPGEVLWISEQVKDKVKHFEQITVPVSPFNHMDLIMSSEAGKFVNKQMVEFIQRNKCLAAAG